MIFILGVIVGFLLALVVLLGVMRFRTPIERTLNQTQSRLSPKGQILEPEDNELSTWVEALPTES